MAATVTTSIQAASTTPATTLETGTLTPTGSNKVLYALVASGASAPSNVSAVKYASTGGSGGESMTQHGSTLAVGANLKAALFRLIGPSASSGTIHATYAGTDDERIIICVAVQDADQTTPNNTLASATGSGFGSTTATVNATSVSGDLVLDFMWAIDYAAANWTITAGAGQTALQEIENGACGPYEDGGSSRETASGTSTTMSWTLNASSGTDWGIYALAVNMASPNTTLALGGSAVTGGSGTEAPSHSIPL